MAGDPNTADKQNELRREQKRKQRTNRKKGFSSHTSAAEKIRLPRVVNAQFSGATKEAVDQRIVDLPMMPITSGFFKKLLSRGVGLHFRVSDDKFPTMNGDEFSVTLEGFDTPIFVHTVRFWTGLGFGIEVKKLPNGKVIVE